MNDLLARKYQLAYDEAIEKAKKPHPLAMNDGDGHCTVCGLPWPRDQEDLPHLCPPGFFYEKP